MTCLNFVVRPCHFHATDIEIQFKWCKWLEHAMMENGGIGKGVWGMSWGCLGKYLRKALDIASGDALGMHQGTPQEMLWRIPWGTPQGMP